MALVEIRFLPWAGRAALNIEVGAAGALIYAASSPDKPIPNFYASNKEAMDDLRECAGQTPEAA